MKEISIKLYEFDELSGESQNAVVERERDRIGYDAAEAYSTDWEASLKKFEELIGVNVKYKIQLDGSGYDYRFEFDEPIFYNSETTIFADEVKGRLLARFIDKIHYDIRSRKYIHHGIRQNCLYCDGRKSRHSKIMWVENECPLTGLIYDCSLLEPIYKWQKKWDMNITLEELVGRCLDKFFGEWEDDIEHCYSDDFVEEELINIDDSLYYENGTKYCGPSIVA